MKMRVKAKVISVGTCELEVPNNFNDTEIIEYIKDNADMLDWDDIDPENIDYDIIEDYILEDGEESEPEDNTYSGGIYE